MIEMDFKNEVIKSVPPVVVSGFTLFGIELNDWVIILTIVYIFIQCVALTFRIHRDQCVFKYRMKKIYGRRKEDQKMPIGCSLYITSQIRRLKRMSTEESKSALERLLVQIHSEIAETMLADLHDPDKRTPQLYGQIIKFLKDNGIDMLYCEKGKNKSAFSELIGAVKEQMDSYQ